MTINALRVRTNNKLSELNMSVLTRMDGEEFVTIGDVIATHDSNLQPFTALSYVTPRMREAVR